MKSPEISSARTFLISVRDAQCGLTSKSKKATSPVFRLSKAWLLPRRAAALPKPLPSGRFPAVSEWKERSLCIRRSLIRLRLSAEVRSEEASCSICAVCPAKLLVSRKFASRSRKFPAFSLYQQEVPAWKKRKRSLSTGEKKFWI